MSKPIVLLGLPGCGKTYWGKKISEQLSLPFFDLDKLITQEAGLTIKEIFDEGGEHLFRSIESSTLFALCNNPAAAQFVLALGGGTPAFNDNMKLINAKCTSIFLNQSVKTIIEQLKNDKINHRPLLEKATDDLLNGLIEKLLKERITSYHMADYMLNENEMSLSNFEKIINDAK